MADIFRNATKTKGGGNAPVGLRGRWRRSAMMIDKITKADNCIIGLFDRATTAVQRRVWLPLNTLIMANDCLFWATAFVTNSDSLWIVVTCLFAGPSLYFAYERWKNANRYWENCRKTQSLNAQVVYIRSFVMVRAPMVASMLPVMSASIFTMSLVWAVNGLALLGMMYLNCCCFIGPGDFARRRQEILSGAWQESQ